MKHRPSVRLGIILLTIVATMLGLMPSASAGAAYAFAGPSFGIAAGAGDVVFAADAGAGIVRLQGGTGEVVVDLPGVTDIGPVKPGRMWAIAGRKLFSIRGGSARFVVGLGRYERLVNPDDGEVDSNPFEVTALGTKRALVADAGANAVLVVNSRGGVNWIATLPDEVVSTENIKELAGCPTGPADVCDLPDEIPAQGVATGVAVGPDGAYYVTELKGFPAPTGESRVWRIEPGTRRVHCDAADTDGPCTVVADGFTSIVDITFGPDGTAYVTELDEASWAAVEIFTDEMVGGTVNACDPETWTCTEAATGLTMPMAVAVNDDGPSVLINALIEGETAVVPVA